jgi:hypothetical protein
MPLRALRSSESRGKLIPRSLLQGTSMRRFLMRNLSASPGLHQKKTINIVWKAGSIGVIISLEPAWHDAMFSRRLCSSFIFLFVPQTSALCRHPRGNIPCVAGRHMS